MCFFIVETFLRGNLSVRHILLSHVENLSFIVRSGRVSCTPIMTSCDGIDDICYFH